MIERIKIIWHSRNLKSLSGDYHIYLSKYSQYYNNLTPKLQKRFRERTFISTKFINFRPVQFDEVTAEMKILITSALVQITFGLNKFILRRFKTILVVPNTYSFKQYKALLGHVDFDENLIVMSWPSVKNGFIIPDDAFNVALHELAHALQSENFDRLLYSKFFDAVTMKEWKEEGMKKLFEIREKRHQFLRQYAGQNMVELFAVCIETFFEKPNDFKSKIPKLYAIMVDLLDQDPTIAGDPRI